MSKMFDSLGWEFPITNVHDIRRRCGHIRKSVPTAIVRDACGRTLMTFAGLPYRRNAEAIENARRFCAAMNNMYIALSKEPPPVL